eukprot:g5997.t1
MPGFLGLGRSAFFRVFCLVDRVNFGGFFLEFLVVGPDAPGENHWDRRTKLACEICLEFTVAEKNKRAGGMAGLLFQTPVASAERTFGVVCYGLEILGLTRKRAEDTLVALCGRCPGNLGKPRISISMCFPGVEIWVAELSHQIFLESRNKDSQKVSTWQGCKKPCKENG